MASEEADDRPTEIGRKEKGRRIKSASPARLTTPRPTKARLPSPALVRCSRSPVRTGPLSPGQVRCVHSPARVASPSPVREPPPSPADRVDTDEVSEPASTSTLDREERAYKAKRGGDGAASASVGGAGPVPLPIVGPAGASYVVVGATKASAAGPLPPAVGGGAGSPSASQWLEPEPSTRLLSPGRNPYDPPSREGSPPWEPGEASRRRERSRGLGKGLGKTEAKEVAFAGETFEGREQRQGYAPFQSTIPEERERTRGERAQSGRDTHSGSGRGGGSGNGTNPLDRSQAGVLCLNAAAAFPLLKTWLAAHLSQDVIELARGTTEAVGFVISRSASATAAFAELTITSAGRLVVTITDASERLILVGEV